MVPGWMRRMRRACGGVRGRWPLANACDGILRVEPLGPEGAQRWPLAFPCLASALPGLATNVPEPGH
eukprot:3812180-Pyramimonas_sp.AAC.1